MNELELKLRQSLFAGDGGPHVGGPHGGPHDGGPHDGGSHDHGQREVPTSMRASARRLAPTGILHKELSYAIVGAAIEVHRHLGPGQLKATYERAFAKELGYRGIAYRRQVPLTTRFKGDAVGEFYADLIVDDKVIIELKSVVAVHHVHKLQVLSYLRASGLRLGLLINFNSPVLWRAIDRIAL